MNLKHPTGVAAVAAAATAAVMAVGASGGAIAAPARPASVTPKQAATVEAGRPFTFKVRSGGGFGVFVTVSTSRRTDADGVLAEDVYFTKLIARKGGLHTRKTPVYPALDDYFLNAPGRYYWQPYRIDCSTQKDCKVEGRIRSFVVTAP